ncbi:MAG: hypothetical protein V7K38_11275, partial [Nostoc sp.]
DGINGQPGTNGHDGVDGHPGNDGINGQPGTNGRDGVDGHPGNDGINGQPGTNGRDGIDGKDGVDGKDAKVEYSTINVQIFDTCDPDTKKPKFKTKAIQVIQGTEALESLKFERLAEIDGQQCSGTEYYAAVPEWWQVRIEAGRPQMIFMFAEDLGEGNFDSAKYPITVPHPIVKHYETSPLPSYQKGQYEGIVILKDNSKIIINAISNEEAERVLTAIKQIVIPEFLEGSIQKISPRRGVELLTITVYPKRVEYFSTGLKKTKSDWVDVFK